VPLQDDSNTVLCKIEIKARYLQPAIQLCLNVLQLNFHSILLYLYGWSSNKEIDYKKIAFILEGLSSLERTDLVQIVLDHLPRL